MLRTMAPFSSAPLNPRKHILIEPPVQRIAVACLCLYRCVLSLLAGGVPAAFARGRDVAVAGQGWLDQFACMCSEGSIIGLAVAAAGVGAGRVDVVA